MVEIIKLEKNEEGVICGLFERELTEEELGSAKAKYEELVVEYEESQKTTADLEKKLNDYNGVFEEIIEPVQEESTSVEGENQPETVEEQY